MSADGVCLFGEPDPKCFLSSLPCALPCAILEYRRVGRDRYFVLEATSKEYKGRGYSRCRFGGVPVLEKSHYDPVSVKRAIITDVVCQLHRLDRDLGPTIALRVIGC